MSQEEIVITGRHIRAARGLLLMPLEDLAAAVGITSHSLTRIETGKAIARPQTLETIRFALEQRGIVFSNGDKPGVMLDREKAVIPS